MAAADRSPLLYQGVQALPPEPPTNYVNGVAITVSPWDFCLLFLRGLPNQPLSETEAEVVAGHRRGPLDAEIVQRIVMSPEHAKSMIARLQENVELYEQEFGEIPTISVAPPAEPNESSSPAPPADTSS
jgi:hypothetical protein